MLSTKVLDRVRAALVLLVLTATVFTVAASAAPDSVRRANASRARNQQAARAKAQSQARQRAQAQQRQRAQAQQRQRAQAQAQARQRTKAQAAQRARAQAKQRAQAQAKQRAQAQAKQRARAQAQAKQRARAQAKKPAKANPRNQNRARDAQRLKHSLNSGSGSVRPGSRPATRPGEAGLNPQTRDRTRPDHADRLQNNDRRPGSITTATGERLPAGASRRDVDWDSAKDRFDQGGNDGGGRWDEIRDEHGDLDFSGGRYEFESSSEWSASGFRIGGGGGYNSGYGNWDDGEDLSDWPDDNRPYTPANNEFYAADSKQPTGADPMIDPRTGEVIGQGTGPGTVSDTSVLLPGSRITKLSSKAVLADTAGEALYFDRGVFFRDHQVGKRYEVVAPPLGAIVPKLPRGYQKVTLSGTEYSICQGVYYKTVYKAGHVVYMVAQVGD